MMYCLVVVRGGRGATLHGWECKLGELNVRYNCALAL